MKFIKKTLGYSLGYTCCIVYVFMVVLIIKNFFRL